MGGPANKPELKNFSAMEKWAYEVRLFMHDIRNDEVFARTEDVEAWVLLVKHRSIQSLVKLVNHWKAASLKFVSGPQRCEDVVHVACRPSDAPWSPFSETSQCGCPAFGLVFHATF